VSIGDLLVGRTGLRISDPRRTSIDVHTHLRDLIISGALPPGTELKQAELARVFAVSRTPLREAFRMLQEEGLISA
jgi:DNA-binding GntR family transcriptional regulator